MNLKKILKRAVSAVAAGAMVSSMLPANLAFANLQRHISNLSIASIPTTDSSYRINFNWNLPTAWSPLPDSAAITPDDVTVHQPDGFLVQGLNATANETKYTDYEDIEQSDAISTTITPLEPLNSGSIYEFQVLPYHYHAYQKNDVRVEEKAPYENNSAIEKVLFMTDIEIEAHGAGNTLTVSWDNPLYKGRDVFSGYRIYYQRGGDKVLNFNTYKDVSIDDEAIRRETDRLRNGVQILTYDIYDANLVMGEYYAVKVEPLYNGVLARDLSATGQSFKSIQINNVAYRMAFRYMNDKEYRTNEANINIPLEVNEDGKDFLKLHWWGISNTIGNIERIEIYDGDGESDIGNLIGTIFSAQALYVNSWQIDKPSSVKYYQLRIYVEGKETPVMSEVAYYDPSIVNITPNQPNIYVNVNAGGTGPTANLDVYWDAFVRYPYNENEEAFVESDGKFVDRNVVYDMWITDSIETINDVNLDIKVLDRVPASELQLTTNENLTFPCYVNNITRYATRDATGAYVMKSIEKNKTYYIKLVATKPCRDEPDKSAEPVIVSVYVPTNENIGTPQSLSKPPLRIKRDEEGNYVMDQTSMTVEWNSKWYEIYNEETDSWYSIVSLRDGELIYGIENIDEENDTLIDLYTAEDETEARELFRLAGFSDDEVAAFKIRLVDLSGDDIQYELKYVPFDEVNASGGYLSYLEILLNSDSQDWTQISPRKNENDYLEYRVTGLEENLAYIVMLRPYRVLSDGTKEAYPTFVIGTTKPDDKELEIQPTVPALQEVDHDDFSFEVKWEEYATTLDYELAVNEILLDDPTKAALFFSMENINENGIEEMEDEKVFTHFTVSSLFPETGYYVWIRSIAHNASGDIYSEWSNPLLVTTDPLSPPDPPDGLGLASRESLRVYNLTNSTAYLPSDYGYLIVEWLKNYNDKGYNSVQNIGGDGYKVLDHEDFTNNFVVMFENLNPNQPYYFRVKTRLTVNKTEDGSAEQFYAYVLQMADNPRFEEAMEIVVSEDRGSQNNAADRFYVIESEWSDVVTLYTEPSDTEYDGDILDEFFPLPDEDFELIYDYPTRSLTYRLRSDKEDSDGFDDNLVDQRFISRLYSNKTFNYSVDLTSYMGGEIRQRIFEIPYTVMSAFEERKISLKVVANNGSFTFKPGFLDTPQINNLHNYGQGATVRLIVTESPSGTPVLAYNQGYLSTPQNVAVTVTTDTGVINLDAMGENMEISMKLDNRYSAVDSNVGLFYDTKTTDLWNRIDYTYDNATGTYNAESAKLATYSVIASAAPVATGSANSQASSNIGNVVSRINITDLSSFNPQGAVSVVQFNNLVSAIAMDKKDAELNGSLSAEEYTSLGRKGILLSGSVVSREQAVDVLVKLYEAKTGMQITYFTPLDSSSYASEIRNAGADYQTSMLKAADLGFFDTSNGARPKDVMSLNELFYMANIILEDCNY